MFRYAKPTDGTMQGREYEQDGGYWEEWFRDNERHGVGEEKSADEKLIEKIEYRKWRCVSGKCRGKNNKKRRKRSSDSSDSDSE